MRGNGDTKSKTAVAFQRYNWGGAYGCGTYIGGCFRLKLSDGCMEVYFIIL